jgi:hypothetical protein
MGSRSRQRRALIARRRAAAWLPIAVLTLACSRERAPKLSLLAALPESVAAGTELELGDPMVQKQLELTGELVNVPFEIGWQNVSGGPQTIEALRASALDGGSVGDTPPIHARFTGLDVKIITVQLRLAHPRAAARAVRAASHSRAQGHARRRRSDRVLVLDGGTIALDLRVDLGDARSRRTPALIDHRERLLAALGVRAPHDLDDGTSLGSSARTGRSAARLERTT